MYSEPDAATQAAEEIMTIFETLDRLLESHPLHRLERWLDAARAHGDRTLLADYYEHNARRLVTVWGPPVDDYAARIWSGLIRDYYRPRWEHYFESLRTEEPFDFPTWEENWVNSTGLSECAPFENPVRAALNAIEMVSTIEIGRRASFDSEVIGRWRPSRISTEWQNLEWKLPAAKLRSLKGVVFESYRGTHRLDIRSVSLILDGKEIAEERHLGSAARTGKKNYYKLEIPEEVKANNECIIRARVRAVGGTDSYGRIMLISEDK